MAWRLRKFQTLLWGVCVCLILCFILAAVPITTPEGCVCQPLVRDSFSSEPEHRLAVIVPYRDRFEELLEFAPHIHKFLNNQKISHNIYVINQVDSYRFNRGSLINIGFLHAKNECDYIAMHDVDLLPLNAELSYAYPDKGPVHIASPELHPKYHYPTFLGGILIMTRQQFLRVKGLSNRYWGWGLEDDEFHARLRSAKMNVIRPTNLSTGTYNTFRHVHNIGSRRRDMIKCYNQKEVTRKRDHDTGLNTVNYTLHGVKHLSIEGAPLRLFHVSLVCDTNLTPWCNCTGAPNIEYPRRSKRKPQAVPKNSEEH